MQTMTQDTLLTPIKFKKKSKKHPIILMTRRVTKCIVRSLQLFNVVSRLYTRLIIQRVDFYQPLYNFSVLKNKRPQRTCIDRADAVYHKIRQWGQGGHILDIGCSLGFFSHYFADRGYSVDGIDSVANNISICQLLQKVNGKKTHFSVALFSKEYLANIKPNHYDIVFLYNVIHHIIYAKGLVYAKELIRDLLDKIPVLFIELAVKEEPIHHPWRKTLPENELDVFELCKDITIEKLGHFSHTMTPVRRPLYMITKNKRQLCGETHTVLSQQFVSHQGNQHHGCRYYDCDNVFIKKYLLTSLQDGGEQISHEIENYKRLPKNHFFPTMLSYSKQSDTIDICLSKIPGDNLHNLMLKGQSVPILTIVKRIIAALEFLLQHGLYHNDLRLWNVMYDGENVVLLDLGFARNVETESTNTTLLWIIAQLHEFTDYEFKYPIITPPNFEKMSLCPDMQVIVDALQTTSSFKEFLAK